MNAIKEWQAAGIQNPNDVPESLKEKTREARGDFQVALLASWRPVLNRIKAGGFSDESTQAVLAVLEQKLDAEDYLEFLNKCIDLRDSRVIDTEVLGRIFFGDFAYANRESGVRSGEQARVDLERDLSETGRYEPLLLSESEQVKYEVRRRQDTSDKRGGTREIATLAFGGSLFIGASLAVAAVAIAGMIWLAVVRSRKAR